MLGLGIWRIKGGGGGGGGLIGKWRDFNTVVGNRDDE